jgi:HEAT repeat protein
MRIRLRGGLTSAIVGLAAVAVTVDGSVARAADVKRVKIPQLIRQLGHEDYSAREAASRELVEIGEPAVPALKSAAETHADPEVRWRAEQAIQVVKARLRAIAAEKVLSRWQGEWIADDGQWVAIAEDQWDSGSPTFGPVEGTMNVVEIREKMTLVDLIIHGGPTAGSICRIILRREADLLYYCGTYGPAHPTEFKTENNILFLTLKRAPKGTIHHARKKTFPMPIP